MQISPAHQLLEIVEHLDELRATPGHDQEDMPFVHNVLTLRKNLGVAGAEAVIFASETLKREHSKIDDFEIARIRLGLIEQFMAKTAPPTASDPPIPTGPASGAVLTYRLRMRSEAALAHAPIESQPSTFELAKSGVALFVYGLIALAVWGWLAPVLHENLVKQYGLAEWLASGLLVLLTIFAYGVSMSALWRRVNKSLQALIEPQLDSKQINSKFMPGYIASALVAGMTIMLCVLIFNYQAHSAAAASESAKVKKVAEIVAKEGPLWGVMTATPPGVDVESGLTADFGSFAGTFGDFFGGVLNPILTFGTLIALAITLLMQRTQLVDEKNRAKESTGVSNLQMFETTFFNLLNLHGTTISDLHFSSDSVQLPSTQATATMGTGDNDNSANGSGTSLSTGRLVFTTVLRTIYDIPNHPDIGKIENKEFVSPRGVYKVIQEKHNYALGHYFRNLYQILAFVDRYGAKLQAGSVEEEYKVRKRYTNMLRAQLSAHELCLLFFNCEGELVDHGAFRNLLIEWEFLEHIPFRYSFAMHHLYIEGYEQSPIDHLVDQYLGDLTVPQHEAGAFGNNPQVASFLQMRGLLHPGDSSAEAHGKCKRRATTVLSTVPI